MGEYTENTDAVVQNLEDAGCGKDTVTQFMELGKSGKKTKAKRAISKGEHDE